MATLSVLSRQLLSVEQFEEGPHWKGWLSLNISHHVFFPFQVHFHNYLQAIPYFFLFECAANHPVLLEVIFLSQPDGFFLKWQTWRLPKFIKEGDRLLNLEAEIGSQKSKVVLKRLKHFSESPVRCQQLHEGAPARASSCSCWSNTWLRVCSQLNPHRRGQWYESTGALWNGFQITGSRCNLWQNVNFNNWIIFCDYSLALFKKEKNWKKRFLCVWIKQTKEDYCALAENVSSIWKYEHKTCWRTFFNSFHALSSLCFASSGHNLVAGIREQELHVCYPQLGIVF